MKPHSNIKEVVLKGYMNISKVGTVLFYSSAEEARHAAKGFTHYKLLDQIAVPCEGVMRVTEEKVELTRSQFENAVKASLGIDAAKELGGLHVDLDCLRYLLFGGGDK